MLRYISVLLILTSVLLVCSENFTPEMRLQELVKMKNEADNLQESMKNKEGSELVEAWDQHFDIMNHRKELAKKYIYDFSLEN